MVLAFIVYNILVVPFIIAFAEAWPLTVWIAVDYLGDIVLVSDVVMRANFLAHYAGEELVTSTKTRPKSFARAGHSDTWAWC